MASKRTKDMTTGSPARLILGFAIPLLFGMLFQQMYSMVDAIIVGKYLGVDALAGVGAAGAVMFLILGFCNGTCTGMSIPIAQEFGAKNYKEMRILVANSAWVVITICTVMTVSVTFLCRPILTLLNTPEDIFELTYRYLFVMFLGIPSMCLYNLLAGFIRSLGDSKTPVLFLILASCLNIALDFFMILVLHIGVAGAAWATVLSQLISGLACLFFIRKKMDLLCPQKGEWGLKMNLVKRLCVMGMPMGIQFSITAIGSVILQSAVNSLGSTAVASITAGTKSSSLFICPLDALGSTMATYAGQNLGARKLDRIRKGLLQAALMGIAYSLVSCVILSTWGKYIAYLFVDSSEVVILDNVQIYLRIASACFPALCLVNTYRLAIQGIGYSMIAIFAGFMELVGRAASAWILIPNFAFVGASWASPVAWIMAAIFLVPTFYFCMARVGKRLLAEPGPYHD